MSGAGGTLGLVNDLSVKLAKQRKQLNALVKEVKSAADKELTWCAVLRPPHRPALPAASRALLSRCAHNGSPASCCKHQRKPHRSCL